MDICSPTTVPVLPLTFHWEMDSFLFLKPHPKAYGRKKSLSYHWENNNKNTITWTCIFEPLGSGNAVLWSSYGWFMKSWLCWDHSWLKMKCEKLLPVFSKGILLKKKNWHLRTAHILYSGRNVFAMFPSEIL